MASNRFAFRTPAACPAFRVEYPGYSATMRSIDDFPDEVPVADAVEQQAPATDASLGDDESVDEAERETPLEASPSDWQAQREDAGPDLDEFEHD